MASVRAVLEALGKKAGPEDDRIEGQPFHDALQLACTLPLRARLVPARAGADTQAVVHIPLPQLPGAPELEDAWIRARLGEDGYLTGTDAQAAACDAQAVPVVTGIMDPDVIDQMIALAQAVAEAGEPDAPTGHQDDATAGDGTATTAAPGRPGARWSGALCTEAWRAVRYAMARLAVDLVSGPAGIAAILRQGLLDQPYNTPSLPLDIRQRTDERIARARKEYDRLNGTATVLGDIPPSDMVRDAWEDWNTDRKRAAVKAVLNAVTVHPNGTRSGGPNWKRELMLSYIAGRTEFDWRF